MTRIAPSVIAVTALRLSACTNPYDAVQRGLGGGIWGAASGAAIGAAAGAGPGASHGLSSSPAMPRSRASKAILSSMSCGAIIR
jgi:hypothetical protein